MKTYTFNIQTGVNPQAEGEVKIEKGVVVYSCKFEAADYGQADAFAEHLFDLWQSKNLMGSPRLLNYERTELQQL